MRAIPGLTVTGCPDVSVVAFDSPTFNIYAVSLTSPHLPPPSQVNDGMKERGWALNALQAPPCLHLAVTVPHTKAGVADRFVRDLGEVTGAIMADPASADNSPAAVL